MPARVLEAFLCGAATIAGVLLVQELRDPYSDLRLHLAGLVDRLQEVKRR